MRRSLSTLALALMLAPRLASPLAAQEPAPVPMPDPPPGPVGSPGPVASPGPEAGRSFRLLPDTASPAIAVGEETGPDLPVPVPLPAPLPAAISLEHPGSTLVPFGREIPRLRCAPLRACVVELEEGETVFATISGDTERWTIDRALAGPRGHTPLLAIKPTACDLSTNLVVSTDRRIYLLDLRAPACPRDDPESPGQDFTPLLRFSYPRLVEWQADAATLAAATASRGLALPAPVPVERLNFRYRWERRGRFPWTPEAVFDDGTHTYIRLPASARQHPAPVLLLVGERGATEVLNYDFQPGPGTAYYVTDRVLDRAALVVGTGRGQRRLNLINEARTPGRR